MDDIVYVLKTLSDPVRVSILEFLLKHREAVGDHEDEVCACDIESFLGLAQSTVSYHMNLLVRAKLVEATKRGRWVRYRLNPSGFEVVTEFVEKFREPASGFVLGNVAKGTAQI